ncbi:hypothetical protein PCANC_01454 [Puccinia coronata f. sp. avenae]|uniref:Uncharacterized protein n=1 Tax=Puccinia coronata f. sp. avenae TaxID=200324 RepID=A0A2N5W305_9BASI|nr:hypothetical protein PCANC_01454 [Puccinia coronata f. sp. avenae]
MDALNTTCDVALRMVVSSLGQPFSCGYVPSKTIPNYGRRPFFNFQGGGQFQEGGKGVSMLPRSLRPTGRYILVRRAR